MRQNSFRRISSVILLPFIAVVSAISSRAQVTSSPIPGPVAQRCGTSSTIKVGAPDASAIAMLKSAVNAMDKSESYRKASKFDIAGVISDRTQDQTQQTGTFHNHEEHNVKDGDYIHESIIDGDVLAVTRNGGTIKRTSSLHQATQGLSNLAFIPKSYLFPLAVLADEVFDSTVTAYFVPEKTPGKNPQLIHIQTVRDPTSKTVPYEIEDWYLDSSTFIPRYVGHQDPTVGNAAMCVTLFTSFENYQTMNGTYIPTEIANHGGRKTLRVHIIQSLSY